MVSAATEFRKNSFNDQDSATLARIAALYQNVADEAISANDSAALIISQMKAFGIEADNAVSIIDAINEVSNNFAVSSSDIATALTKTSSAMGVLGNDFNQTVGLVTAGTEIMTGQASKVARGLRTIGNNLADAAQEADAITYSVNGTTKALSLMDSATGDMKSTFQIMHDLKDDWDNMSNAEKQAIAITYAGKNQFEVFAAVMDNFQTAITATDTALNSAGSAIKENEAYQESLEFQTQNLKATFQDLATNVIDKQLVSSLLNLGNGLLKLANTDIGQLITKISLLTATGWGLQSLVKVSKIIQIVTGQFRNFSAVLSTITNPALVQAVGGIGTAFRTAAASVGGFSAIALPSILAITTAVVGGIELFKLWADAMDWFNDESEQTSKNLADINSKIQEMEDPSSEYNQLKENVDNLTEAEQNRLNVLELQLANLKEQQRITKDEELKQWSQAQMEERPIVTTTYGDTGDFGVTETTYYTEAEQQLEQYRNQVKALADAYADNKDQKAYVLGLQEIIDGAGDTVTKLRELDARYKETGDDAFKLAFEQRQLLSIFDDIGYRINNATNGTKEFGDAVSETTSEVDSYIDALNEYRQANQNTVDSNGILVQSLFDSNGQLTETGLQALQTSDSMASMAQSFIEAQQAQAQADFSALILAIQEVGSQASITASQIASMMSMAGVSISGVETEGGSAKFKGWLSAQLGRAATNQDVLDYIRQQGEVNYKKKMDEYKNQLSQIGGYVSSGAKSTAKNVENTAKQATDNIANYAKEQAEAVSQEIEDMFSKLRDTEEDYWDAKIDALEEQNKEIDRQVQLEEKLKALEEAKNQKVLLYKDGRFQYDTNRATVASAQYDLNKTWIDVSLDKQKDILTKMKNGALDLIDEWKEKALEQGELTAEDINTLLGEYHDLGNAQYETVAWGTAGISNLIGTGMSVIGNAIAKSQLGQQLGLGNLNQQLANSGAFSGLYTSSDLRSGGTSGADLLNKNFGAGLTPTGTGGGTTKATGKIPTYRSQYGTTTWGGKDLNAPSTTTTALKGIRESYVEDAIKYGAGIAWWIQRMTPTNDYLGPGSYGETYESLLNTDWQSRAFGAKSAEELMDYMQRSAAQKIIGGYDGDINEWYDKTSLDAYRALYFRDPKAAIGNLYTDPDYRLYDALLFSKYFGKKGEIPDFETAGKTAFSSAFEESGPWSRQQLEQTAAVGSAGASEWATAKILELSVKSQLDQLEAIDKQLEENDERQKTASGEELKQLRLLNKELTGTRKDIIDNFGKYETGVASWDVYGQPTVEREERWATDEELEAIGVTRPSRAKALQAQIDALSAAWWETDDPAEKAKLHRQAEALRAELAEEALQTAGSDASDAMEIDGTPMTDEERYDMMRVQLAENSKAWFDASDAEKARLHDENEAIRKQLEDAGQSYARGTTYARGGLSLVGEDGPEMRVLGKGDGIIPSDVTSNLWKFGQNPHMFMRSYGQSLSNMFNISNLTLPNVHDAQSLVSGLERMAHQYVAQRS